MYRGYFIVCFLACIHRSIIVFANDQTTRIERKSFEHDLLSIETSEWNVRPLRELFEMKTDIKAKRSALERLNLTFIHSKRVTVSRIFVNNETIIKQQKTTNILLKEKVAVGETIHLTMEALIEDSLVNTKTGYHTENVLLAFNWHAANENHHTGFIPFLLPFVKPGCESVFDVDNGSLRPDQVSAKSFYESSPPHFFGENNIGWCARELVGQYIEALYLQVLFDRFIRITSIQTGRREGKEDWIKMYQIKYMVDGIWYDYMEHGKEKIFQGSKFISDTPGWLIHPIECDGIRLYPFESDKPIVCTRISIKGCYVGDSEDNCIAPIGMENGKIPDESLSDISTKNDEKSDSRFTRINTKETGSTLGWQGLSSSEDYVQVDMGSLYKITRVGIQCGYICAMFVTDFIIRYTNNTNAPNEQWKVMRDDTGQPLVMHGPEEMSYAAFVTVLNLPKPIVGRSFRIVPTVFKIRKAMRIELYGCHAEFPVDDCVSPTGRSMLVDKMNARLIICQEKVNRGCIESTLDQGFAFWKGLPLHIKQIVAVDEFNNYYGLTHQRTYTVKRNQSQLWYHINEKEWKRSLSDNPYVTMAVSIPDILPSRSFMPNLQWQLSKSHNILVSGEGVFLSHTSVNGSETKVIARWHSCDE